MQNSKSFFTSKSAILGLFAIISILLAIPLVVLLSQEKQDSRQFAEEQSGAVKGIKSNAISGYVYRDSNANGLRDPEEKPYPNAKLLIADNKGKITQQSTAITTDSFGYFTLQSANVDLSVASKINLVLPDGFRTSTANPVSISGSEKQIFEFGIVGNSATPSPTCTPRPPCLDSEPRCLIAEPSFGWCPKVSVMPSRALKITPTFGVRPTGDDRLKTKVVPSGKAGN